MSWKDEFYRLYTSTEENSECAAFDLKWQNLPEKLFRYRPLGSTERLKRLQDEINTGFLFACPITNQNDPFEGFARLKINTTWRKLLNIETFKSICRDHFKDYLKSIPSEKIFNSEDWFEKLLQFLAKQEGESVDELITLFVVSLEKELGIYFAIEMHTKIRQFINCISFSEKHDNLPMWNHYANEYRGVCLEYSTNKITDDAIFQRLFPVVYVSEFPAFEYFDFTKWHERCDCICTHKLLDWGYEQEWRFLTNINYLLNQKSLMKMDTIPKSNEGCYVEFIKPSKIYLGSNIEEKDEQIIIHLAQVLSIPVSKMNCSSRGLEWVKLL